MKEDGKKVTHTHMHALALTHIHAARKEIRRMVPVLVPETSPEAIAGVSDLSLEFMCACL